MIAASYCALLFPSGPRQSRTVAQKGLAVQGRDGTTPAWALWAAAMVKVPGCGTPCKPHKLR